MNDVDAPIEVETDFRRTARGFRLDASDPGNAVHRFFDRTRDGNQGLIGGRLAVIDDDDDARKISLREDRDRKLPGGVETRRAQQADDHQNGAGLV